MTVAPIPIRLFVSYAHDDSRRVAGLLKLVRPRLKCSAKDFKTTWWIDSGLVLGKKWNDAIKAKIAACDYGVQLVSPAFLTRPYISEQEIPAFIGSTARKGALPVMLVPVPFGPNTEMFGIEELQVFRDAKGRAYSECTTASNRERFATELAEKIADRFRWDRDGGDGDGGDGGDGDGGGGDSDGDHDQYRDHG